MRKSYVSTYSNIKVPVPWELRWVLLYINQKFFSRAIVPQHKISILLKGYFTIYVQKKIQRMNGPTILDGLQNSRWGDHNCWAYLLSGDILKKHYCIVGTAESRIMQTQKTAASTVESSRQSGMAELFIPWIFFCT